MASRAGSPGRRRVQDAPPLELAEEARRCRRSGPPSQRPDAEPSRPAGEAAALVRPSVHAPYAIVRPQMQTSLARRQRHRRALQGRPTGRTRHPHHADRRHRPPLHPPRHDPPRGRRRRRSPSARTTTTRRACPIPRRPSTDLEFEQQTIIYDRTGKIELARLGELKREVVDLRPDCPGEIIDATTAIEDKDFWSNAGFDPVGIVSAGLDTISGRPRGASTITQQLVRARLLPTGGLRGLHLRAQDPRDHPVDPPDRGLSGRGRQAGRSSPPT